MRIKHTSGKVVAVFPLGADTARWFDDQGLDPAAYTIEYTPAEQRDIVQRDLDYTVADTSALLDSTSDATAIALSAVATLVKGLQNGVTLADLKRDMRDFAPALIAFADSVDAGDTVLPYTLKGTLDEVLPQLAEQATRVSDVVRNPMVRDKPRRGRGLRGEAAGR